MPRKVILDTDIGSDVDDVWALTLTLACPEIELLGVTTVSGDAHHRAKIALKILDLAGFPDIPVAVGCSDPIQYGAKSWWTGNEGHTLDFSDVDESRLSDLSAIQFIMQKAAQYPGEVEVIAIGPLTNIGVLARDHPAAFASLKSLYVMGGNYSGVDARTSVSEYNFKCDPEAAHYALNGAIPTVMAGLNVTYNTRIDGWHMDQLEQLGTKLAMALRQASLHYISLFDRDFTYMHDPLIVAAAVDPEILKLKRLVPRIQTEGQEMGAVTFTEDSNRAVDVAVDVDIERFQNFLWQRISGLACKSS